jgi:hypothetical protein
MGMVVVTAMGSGGDVGGGGGDGDGGSKDKILGMRLNRK